MEKHIQAVTDVFKEDIKNGKPFSIGDNLKITYSKGTYYLNSVPIHDFNIINGLVGYKVQYSLMFEFYQEALKRYPDLQNVSLLGFKG